MLGSGNHGEKNGLEITMIFTKNQNPKQLKLLPFQSIERTSPKLKKKCIKK